MEIIETENKILIDNLIEDLEGCVSEQEDENDAKKAAVERENEVAEGMRKAAMETLGQTKRRCPGDLEEKNTPKQQRTSGTETVRFLAEKQQFANEKYDEEMKVRKLELEVRKMKVENNYTMMNQMIQTLAASQQQNQQQANIQQQQMQQQMEQQNQLFMAMFEKIK